MTADKSTILNRMFTRSTVRHLLQGHTDSAYTSVIKRYIADPDLKTNGELISEIYCELDQHYRNEFYYKNTLLNKLLLGVHSINTTAVLTEIPIAKSKADFILINGKAVVYEIKTELDNLDRLTSQIDDYYKAFDHVAVVTHEKNVSQLQKRMDSINKSVGIYVLKKNNSLCTIRKPRKHADNMSKDILFKLLRKNEYESIIMEEYGYLPDATQFQYYTACKNLFMQISLEEAYLSVLKVLKSRTKVEKQEFVKVPYELKFLAYVMELKADDYHNLNLFLESRFEGA